MSKSVLIIGAGPAGLTAAYELSNAGFTDITVLEATAEIGGLSRTVRYGGNRIDIGGHRFFSKSDWVMRWWLDMLPIAPASEPHSLMPESGSPMLAYQGQRREMPQTTPRDGEADAVMLVRDRLSRILFGGKLFDYPLKLNFDTALKLGAVRCTLFGFSYVKARLFPRPEVTLEDFFINRFGVRLYHQFFKEYTEKVWGRSCTEISADWGAQRVKSLSIGKALVHAIKQLFASKDQIRAEQTSLIEHFLYPRLGPGQMWEVVADKLRERGVEIIMDAQVAALQLEEGQIVAVDVAPHGTEPARSLRADVFISTMPIRDLVDGIRGEVPPAVRAIAHDLEYRDFITVGLLYSRLGRDNEQRIAGRATIPDNWIYIQEPGVKVGRLQIFNNWSPYLVADPDKVWVGLEFFCNEGDALWAATDEELLALSKREMAEIGLALPEDCSDGVVIRMPKAYPGYYGSAYANFSKVREFLDAIPNLFLIGRNGMHRYNNQDHSMLSAKCAVEAIVSGSSDKSAIWAVNIDDDYHEEVEHK